jgi:hypothetical protein
VYSYEITPEAADQVEALEKQWRVVVVNVTWVS